MRTRLGYGQVYHYRWWLHLPARIAKWGCIHTFEPLTMQALGWQFLPEGRLYTMRIQHEPTRVSWQRLTRAITGLYVDHRYVQPFCADVLPLLGIQRAAIGQRLYWGMYEGSEHMNATDAEKGVKDAAKAAKGKSGRKLDREATKAALLGVIANAKTSPDLGPVSLAGLEDFEARIDAFLDDECA